MGPISVSQILNVTMVLLCFVYFSGGGVSDSGPSLSFPSGLPWGIKGVLSIFLEQTNLHAQDLTLPRPQGPGEI